MAITSTDPRVLVEAYKGGDRAAFDEIVRQYYEGLFAHAVRRLGDPTAAEDAVQETLARAYKAIGRFNGQYQLRAWLHRILTNVCHDEGRRRQREISLVERVGVTAVDELPADEDIGHLDVDRHSVLAALSALPESYRQALVLRYVDELSFAQVAEATGISEGNARLRVHRGRNALRRALAPLLAIFAWLVPMVKRAERSAWAAGGDPSAAAALAASSPTASRAAETAVALAERGPALSNLFGLAATVVVPAAVPMVSSTFADQSGPARRPIAAAVAAPAEELADGVAPPTTVAVKGGLVTVPPVREVVPPTAPPTTEAPTPTTAPPPPAPTTTSPPTTVAEDPLAVDTVAPTAPTTVVPPTRSPTTAVAPSPTTVPARPRRVLSVAATDLAVVRGSRTELSGSVRLTVGGKSADAVLTGPIELPEEGRPAPTGSSGAEEDKGTSASTAAAPSSTTSSTSVPASTTTTTAPYSAAAAPSPRPAVRADLTLAFSGARIRLRLEAVATEQPDGTLALEGTYLLVDACDVEVGAGDLRGELTVEEAPVASSLSLELAEAVPDLATITTAPSC